MQTFVPYSNIQQCANVLDYRRLGKQRVEVFQLLLALNGQSKGWRNHPAALMWKGHEGALALYGLEMCLRWIKMGYKDTCSLKIYNLGKGKNETFPTWFGDEKIHSSHRAALLAKDFVHYSQFNWNEQPRIDYVWPTKLG